MNERHDGILEEGEQYIELDAEVAEAFRNSRAVSTNHGNSYNLMKVGAKRRRTKDEIEEDKRRKRDEEIETAQKLQEHAEMQQ